MESLYKYLRATPDILFISSILGAILTGDVLFLVFAVITKITTRENHLMKKISRRLMENTKYHQIGARPENFKPMHCKPDKKVSWGMPSHHAQISAMTATFWTYYLIDAYHEEIQNEPEKKKQKYTQLIFSASLLWILVLLVCYQRVSYNCHTVFQTLSGVFFGVLFGRLSYKISYWLLK